MLRIAFDLVVRLAVMLFGLVLLVLALSGGVATAATFATAVVTQDRASLRATPRDSGREQAILWQGETVEVRGERLDYLQIYDHRRERAGFVKASQIRRIDVTSDAAPELLAIVRFLRDTPGNEALGIAFVAAYVEAAAADVLNGTSGIEALDALGTLADRLARRASSTGSLTKAQSELLAAHLESASRYGVAFASREIDGRMIVCYDGDAFRRVLAMSSNHEQRGRAALALTRDACFDPDLHPAERKRVDEWRAAVLDRVDVSKLASPLRNRVLMARASVWSALAYQRARAAEPAESAAQRAISELAAIDKSQLTDNDLPAYNDAAMRVNASRWAAGAGAGLTSRNLRIVALAGEPGQTCVLLVEAKGDTKSPLIRRCTYGIVWTSSATLNREGNALALAVQPLNAWREIWVFRKDAGGWTVRVLPPASTNPNLGYVEFAGWVPGGKQMLIAREARGDGKYKHSFEVVRLDTLATERQSSDPTNLAAFRSWQDPVWKRETLSVR